MKKIINHLFPLSYKNNKLFEYIRDIQKGLSLRLKNKNSPRLKGNQKKDLFKKYSSFPKNCKDPKRKTIEIIKDFLMNIPRWRSPNLFYNIGAPTNIASVAAYAIALDENVYNINKGLAGEAIEAEKIVTKIFLKLANVKKGCGFFVFGGSATILYGLKVGIKKSSPRSGIEGISKDIFTLIPEEAHFAHSNAADWLGIGTKKIIKIKANKDRSTNLENLKEELINLINQKKKIATIYLNGGTSYNHTVDDIKKVYKIRNKIVRDFNLKYKPHIHVDSVIGWFWLSFKDYDFKKNNLKLTKESIKIIKKQLRKIEQIKYADSWGIDFHKGIGGCPVNCSLFILNDNKDLEFLRKEKSPVEGLHQLAENLNEEKSIAHYTLETSRSAGPPLSAIVSIFTQGLEGYRKNLANLINFKIKLNKELKRNKQIEISNKESLGFVTMFQILPKKLCDIKNKIKNKDQIKEINQYTKDFLIWDYEKRISINKDAEYSYSSGFINSENEKLFTGKIYPVSPYLNEKKAKEIANIIISQIREFYNENAKEERNKKKIR